MANVKNNHKGPLNVGGVNIPAGVTASVDKWDSVKLGNGVRVWLASGLIEVVAPVASLPGLPGLPGLPAATNADPELAAKQVIIEQLRAFGIEKTTKSKLENLQAALTEAQANAAS